MLWLSHFYWLSVVSCKFVIGHNKILTYLIYCIYIVVLLLFANLFMYPYIYIYAYTLSLNKFILIIIIVIINVGITDITIILVGFFYYQQYYYHYYCRKQNLVTHLRFKFSEMFNITSPLYRCNL